MTEEYYDHCKKMFTEAIMRIVLHPLNSKKKVVKYMKDIDKYIDIAARGDGK